MPSSSVSADDAAAQLFSGGQQARIDQRLGNDGVAGPAAGQDHGGQRRLRSRRHQHMLGVGRLGRLRQPLRAGRALGGAAAGQLVGHQHMHVLALHDARQSPPQQLLHIAAQRRRRQVHAQVQHQRRRLGAA